MRDGLLVASGHNWVEGQGTGARIDQVKGEEEDKFDQLGNKIAAVEKKKKLSAADARKAKKDRIARRKRGEEVCYASIICFIDAMLILHCLIRSLPTKNCKARQHRRVSLHCNTLSMTLITTSRFALQSVRKIPSSIPHRVLDGS